MPYHPRHRPPVRWALLIPGAALVAAIAAWARVPLRAGIGVTPDRILIRTAMGDTTAVPWAQVSGFEGGKGSSTRDSEGTVYVLTSGGGGCTPRATPLRAARRRNSGSCCARWKTSAWPGCPAR
ncbi:MAG TPA: hypothetical protein VHZ03_12395 [Trebonia sp.]|nr:hypothetical protein [Trebonia sp.]